jgi:hypothetical protein
MATLDGGDHPGDTTRQGGQGCYNTRDASLIRDQHARQWRKIWAVRGQMVWVC